MATNITKSSKKGIGVVASLRTVDLEDTRKGEAHLDERPRWAIMPWSATRCGEW